MQPLDHNRSDRFAFRLLKGVLSAEDIDALKSACKKHLQEPDPIPCYVLLNGGPNATINKIEKHVGEALGRTPYYLNDFYFYSDNSFGAQWHVDTELFTFDECWNAWILLSPDEITNPLAIMGDMNGSPEDYFHSLKIEDENVIFQNYRNGKQSSRTISEIDRNKLDTPKIEAGDIFLFNPKLFHKTNTTVPKHAMVIKYVLKGPDGFASKSQVPPMFWPEVRTFNRMLKGADDWNVFLSSLRSAIRDPEQRKALSAGFFPEKIPLYKEMSATL